MSQYYLSEWIADTNAKDIPLHIYAMPLTEEEKRHSAGGSYAFTLSKYNGYQTITFYDQYIASFHEIEEWNEYSYIKNEHRVINPEKTFERKLFERLVKKEIENLARKDYVIDRGSIRLKKELPLRTKELLIYPALYLTVNVELNGSIIVGFEYKHRFEYNETLLQLISKKNSVVRPGIKVIDSTNSKSHEYMFVEIGTYTANQESPYLKESIINYYNRNKKEWKLKGVREDSMVVHVEDKNGRIFPYLPHLLKLSCSFDTLPAHLINMASKAIKLSPKDKMPVLLRETYKLLTMLSFISFPKENVLVEKLGYNVKYANNPMLRFGNNTLNEKVNTGLLKGGVFSGKEAHVSFFVDPELQSSKRQEIGKFIESLKSESNKLGVNLIISSKPKELRGKLDYHTFSSNDIGLQLKSLPDFFEGTVVVLTTDKNSHNAYKPIKREFGGKQDIITQFIIYDDSLLDPSKSRYTFLNILLGIFVKSGLQPWVLADNLNSDCLIGLDVSHEEGKHSSGIIQIIGRDGRMIKQKAMATNEAGEIISWETIQDIIYDCIHSYEVVYGMRPKHITFHRDGFCREDLDKIDKTLSAIGISFDYVEVLKNVNRRMAVYENNQWTTHQSLYYQKEKEGFLCATSPKEFVGMAKPIKVVQKTSCLSFDEIINDIYKLSFMHVHSMLKTRLPVTTHYADLSSTFHNRGLIHPASKHELALPFV